MIPGGPDPEDETGLVAALGLLAGIDPGAHERLIARPAGLYQLIDWLVDEETVRWLLPARVPAGSGWASGLLAVCDEQLLFLPADPRQLPVGRWALDQLRAVPPMAVFGRGGRIEALFDAGPVSFGVDRRDLAEATIEALSVALTERAGSPESPVEALRGARVDLVPIQPEHVERLRALHGAPGVVEWWQQPAPDWPGAEDPETTSYTVLFDDRVAGFARWYAEDRDEFERAGLDLFLDPAVHGRGLGTEVVQILCSHLIDVEGYHRLVIDPAAGNAAAIACYTKVGFRPVGVMREYGRDRHGRWYDGLLMDLLAAELVRTSH